MPRGNKLKPIFIPPNTEFSMHGYIYVWKLQNNICMLEGLRPDEISFTIATTYKKKAKK